MWVYAREYRGVLSGWWDIPVPWTFCSFKLFHTAFNIKVIRLITRKTNIPTQTTVTIQRIPSKTARPVASRKLLISFIVMRFNNRPRRERRRRFNLTNLYGNLFFFFIIVPSINKAIIFPVRWIYFKVIFISLLALSGVFDTNNLLASLKNKMASIASGILVSVFQFYVYQRKHLGKLFY